MQCWLTDWLTLDNDRVLTGVLTILRVQYKSMYLNLAFLSCPLLSCWVEERLKSRAVGAGSLKFPIRKRRGGEKKDWDWEDLFFPNQKTKPSENDMMMDDGPSKARVSYDKDPVRTDQSTNPNTQTPNSPSNSFSRTQSWPRSHTLLKPGTGTLLPNYLITLSPYKPSQPSCQK